MVKSHSSRLRPTRSATGPFVQHLCAVATSRPSVTEQPSQMDCRGVTLPPLSHFVVPCSHDFYYSILL